MKKVIKLFESCSITIGASRSMITDMQRQNYYLVPNSLALLFDKDHVFNTEVIGNTEENRMAMNEYIDFLIGNELCFYVDENLLPHFPKIDLEAWDYPAHITNAVIELDFNEPAQGLLLLKELTGNYLTRHVEVQAAGSVELDIAEQVLSQIDQLDLYSYNLVMAFRAHELELGIRLIRQHYKIFRSTLHSTGRNEIIESGKAGWGTIFLMKEAYSNKHCGVVDTFNFTNTIDHITESQQHNTCLNRKIAIDAKGNIRNCPGMCKSHGNTKHTGIKDILKDPGFTRLWHIKKDEIAVCKDCEFRHICTDCRAFTEDPEDVYSKPLKCGYDPYTNQWEEWSTLPHKQKAIEFYGMSSIISPEA